MYKKLLSNKTYIGNAVIFTILWGTYTAIGNLLSPIFGPHYTASEISLIGGVFVLCGVLGCFLAGLIIDKTQAMLGTIRTIATVVTVLLFIGIWIIPSGHFIGTLICAALLGLFIVPSITACYTFTVHLTYPIPPAASNGLIMTGAHIYAITFSLIGPKMLKTSFVMSFATVTTLCLIATIISYVIFNPNQNGSMKKNEQDPEMMISVIDEQKNSPPKFGKKNFDNPMVGVDIAKRTESLNHHDMTENSTPAE